MQRRLSRSIVAVVAFVAGAGSLSGATAEPTVESIETAAVVGLGATAELTAMDIVSISNKTNALSADVHARVAQVAETLRATWALGRSASVGMDRVMRGGAVVQQAPATFHYPMGVSVLPLTAVAPLMGRNVAGVLASGAIVMGRTTADLRGAQVGDTVDLVAADSSIKTFTIGLVAADAVVGGTELLLSTAHADVMGIAVNTRVLLWGFPSRTALDAALADQGLTTRSDTRIRRSWDAPDPDSTIGIAQTKLLLGEFVYRVRDDEYIDTDGAWPAANVPGDREVLLAEIPIRARCHNTIRADLVAALAEVHAAGLGTAIDVNNANAYGGCYNPRFNRTSGALGFISRHAWAQALDTNTVANAQGNVPVMDCGVVRIFRKHNFAWGGNFLTPDGMHFEWVGQRRDLLQYPSAYCPNLPTPPSPTVANSGTDDWRSVAQPSRATLFADDGFISGHD